MWSGLLVEMADTLVDDYDVVDLLTGLADRCVQPAGRLCCRGDAGLPGRAACGLVASSSEAMRLLELFELQAQEGPCLDAFRTGERVEHENLAAPARPLAVVFAPPPSRPASGRRPHCRCGCARRPSAR